MEQEPLFELAPAPAPSAAQLIESLLFIAGEPVTVAQLAQVLELPADAVDVRPPHRPAGGTVAANNTRPRSTEIRRRAPHQAAEAPGSSTHPYSSAIVSGRAERRSCPIPFAHLRTGRGTCSEYESRIPGRIHQHANRTAQRRQPVSDRRIQRLAIET